MLVLQTRHDLLLEWEICTRSHVNDMIEAYSCDVYRFKQDHEQICSCWLMNWQDVSRVCWLLTD